MDLRRLRYFLAVAEELHFGRAARRLGIEQPPLSRQVRKLEDELGVRLFDRSKRRVELTVHGRHLKLEAARLLEQAELLRNNLRRLPEDAPGPLRIGYVGSAMYSLLPEVLGALRAEWPEQVTQLEELVNDDQVRALRRGELDLGFVRPPVEARGLDVRPAFREPYALALPARHRLAASRRRPELRALAAEPFLFFGRACSPGMFDEVQALCRRAGFVPRQTHAASHIHTLLSLVGSGLGYSIVPASAGAAGPAGVRFFPLAGLPERTGLAVLSNPALRSPGAARALAIVERLERAGRAP